MSKFLKICSMILVIAMLVSVALVGCGNSTTNNASTSSSTQDTKASDSSAAPAQNDNKPVTIRFAAPEGGFKDEM